MKFRQFMKFFSKKNLLLISFSAFFSGAFAQNNFFTDAPETALKITGQKRVIVPNKYRTLKLDNNAVLSFLQLLPKEQNVLYTRTSTPIIEIPMPDGTSARFHVWENSTMAPELAAAFPTIRTYTGQGIDDPAATISFDVTELGFHAMILSAATGSVFIDPYDQTNYSNYISYFKKDYSKRNSYFELPPIKPKTGADIPLSPGTTLAAQCIGTQLRTYRLAVACTGEYAKAATGLSSPSVAQTLSAITTSVNRVNSVYEKEIDIHLTLIATENKVIFTNPATDPFLGNDNSGILINESQRVIDSAIGNSNYDIGHTFSTGGGGYAQVEAVCRTGEKAMGITGSASPVGDPYDIDYVCHEMGHEFGADHTFNDDIACGSTSPTENTEPGSGSTIIAYAGVCNYDNLQSNSDPQFQAISFDVISTYVINSVGNNCAVRTATGNTSPVVNAGADYIIPISTPFVLTGTATDANDAAGSLTYSWEQVDVGGPNGISTSPSGNAPLFRSFKPVSNGTRYFPKLSNVIASDTTIGELMPNYARTMHFRLTVRDNHAGGGGVCFDEAAITVNATTPRPFKVTYPTNTGVTWVAGDFQIVTWDIAGTAAAPISCANVAIQLSTDGGLTFPVTIVASTPNDGSEEILVPNNITTQARIRIMAVGNVFYNISRKNFTITNAASPGFTFNFPSKVLMCSVNTGATTLRTGSQIGFTTAINLSASLNPGGTTVTFGTNPLTPGNNTTVTLNNAGSLAPGSYVVRITGIAGSVTKTRDITFFVGTAIPPASLSAPSADAIGVSLLPSFNWSTVASALSYVLEISTSNTFSPVTQTIANITTLPYTLTTPLAENTIYYWRVKTVTDCGTGPASVTMRFKTGINTCITSTDVPKTISAAVKSTVTSTITIPPASGVNITDLNVVGLNITHSYINDITVSLKSPSNTTVVLFNQICDTYADFNLSLDDQAATAIPCPATGGGAAMPENPLSAFNGQNSAGTWTLTIQDNFVGDGGALNGWALNINTNSTNCFAATSLGLTYTFTGNGNWNVASNWANNAIPPATLLSGDSIVINHTAGGQCLLNISQTISPGGKLTVMTGKNLVVAGSLKIQ